jgi:hypothetical protein
MKITVLYDLWEEEPAEVPEEFLHRASAKGKRSARRSR